MNHTHPHHLPCRPLKHKSKQKNPRPCTKNPTKATCARNARNVLNSSLFGKMVVTYAWNAVTRNVGEGVLMNILFKGDNSHVLECVGPDYREKVVCVYADPPYNTGDTHHL